MPEEKPDRSLIRIIADWIRNGESEATIRAACAQRFQQMGEKEAQETMDLARQAASSSC